jgi:uncharacterized cupredoxin-like copper-binding protein
MKESPMGRIVKLTVFVMAGMLVVAACGDAGQTVEASDTIEVLGTDDLRFEPDEFVVPAGEEVTVELTSAAVEHDFNIEGASDAMGDTMDDTMDDNGDEHPEVPHDDVHVVHVDAGATGSGSFTIDEPGAYTVYCSVPGHREAGMAATLEVLDTTA